MKKALILGGGSDIGGAIVRELSPDHEVTSTYFHSAAEAALLPGKIMQCDIRDLQQIQAVIDEVGENIDLLITSAFPFLEGDNLDFNAYLEAQAFLTGHVYAILTAAKKMNHGGRIINILGQCVERGLPGGAFYSGSFAFLHNLSNSINAREGKAGKVAACDLLLGPVDTREWTGLSTEVVDRYKAKVVDFIKPEQIARTTRFLVGEAVMPSTFKLDGYYGY